MNKLEIEKGTKFGHLTIEKEVEMRLTPNGKRIRQFLCKCDCGKLITVSLMNLRSGNTKGCGCLRGHSNITHNLSKTRLYRCWHGMKRRCCSITNEKYFYYGGRGIKLHPLWYRFEPFLEWSISHGYNDTMTLDRIDVNGNYEPSNCRWVTMKEQANNKRNNHKIEYQGTIRTIAEWSDITGIRAETIRDRLMRGFNLDAVFSRNKHKSPRKPFKTDKYKAEIIYLYSKGYTKTGIGKKINIGRNYIAAALKRWANRK